MPVKEPGQNTPDNTRTKPIAGRRSVAPIHSCCRVFSYRRFLNIGLGILVCALILTGAFPAAAQYAVNYNSRQFLDANQVYHIVRDSKGFLWFCTDNGLVRYDGHVTKRFGKDVGLADNDVFNAFEDSKGRIWPFCFNGQYCFLAGDSVHNAANDATLRRLPVMGSYITGMSETKRGEISFGFRNRCILWLLPGGRSYFERHSEGINHLYYTDSGIRFSPKSGASFQTENEYRVSSVEGGVELVRSSQRIWERRDSALNYLAANDAYFYRRQLLAVSTTSGLYIIDIHSNRTTHLLPGINVTSCTEDNAGNLWVSTLNAGVYRIQGTLERIHKLELPPHADLRVVNDQQLVYVQNGLYRLESSGDSLKSRLITDRVPQNFVPVIVSDTVIVGFDFLKRHTKIYFQGRNGWEPRPVYQKDRLPLAYLKQLAALRPGYFFGFGGLLMFSFDMDTKHVSILDTVRLQERVATFCQDRHSSQIYYTCGSGLFVVDTLAGRSRLMFQDSALRQAVAMQAVAGNLLIADGTARLREITGLPDHPRWAEIRIDFPVTGLSIIDEQRLLATSTRQNYIIDFSGSEIRVSKLDYPLSSNEFDRFYFSGRFCVARRNADFYYHDTSLLRNVGPGARIYPGRLLINGKAFDVTNGEIAIRNTRSCNVQLEFGVLDYNDEVQTVRYRLMGPGDTTWYRTDSRELNFVIRNPGVYAIQVEPLAAASAKRVILAQIHIYTPFTESAGFYFLCVLLLAGLATVVLVLVSRYRKRLFDRELTYLRLEHRAINALLNPHFVFNSIANIQNLVLSEKRREAADYLVILSRLIRQNLENLEYNLVRLDREIDLIKYYIRLQNLRFEDKIKLHIGLDPEHAAVMVPPLLLHSFVENSIVHGLEANVPEYNISIRITQIAPAYLQIEIEDNGIGVNAGRLKPRAVGRTSMGISFNKRRLQRLSDFYDLKQEIQIGDLSDEGRNGTRITVRLYMHLGRLLEERPISVH